MQIPVIDFSKFKDGNKKMRANIADKIGVAASNVGFMVILNAPMDFNLYSEAIKSSKNFFNLAQETKEKYTYNSKLNFGYQGIEGQRLDQKSFPDLKEAITMRNIPALFDTPEIWPSLEFSSIANEMFNMCKSIANDIMEAFAINLEVPLDFFKKCHLGENSALRYLHYPLIRPPTRSEQMGVGAHTDFGTITLLFQDQAEGLEVQTSDRNWTPVPFMDDAIIVNVGDLLFRWTNGRIRSAPHRVKPQIGRINSSSGRYSIAFFADPDSSTLVKVIDSCIIPGNPSRFLPITAGKYLEEKIRESHVINA